MTQLASKQKQLLIASSTAVAITVLANILWALASGGIRDALTILGVLAFALASGLNAYVSFNFIASNFCY